MRVCFIHCLFHNLIPPPHPICSDDFSLVRFYFIYDDAEAEDGISYLPLDLSVPLTVPTTAVLTAELEAVGFMDPIIQMAPSCKNIQNSFGKWQVFKL